ncbi:MAG TPA: hypothetical protein VEZ59_01755 [Sphingopyxis sp.]|nr:hypothetical protein [Sphingopyxis sp.]
MTDAFDRATRRIISRSRTVAGLCPMINVSSTAWSPFRPTSVISVSTAPPGALSMDQEIDEIGKQDANARSLTHSK